MFSARKLLTVALLGIVSVSCQRVEQSGTQILSPAPIIEDEAMALRQWDETASYYANGSSVSYPTLYPYVPRSDAPAVEGLVTAPLLFMGQTIFLPITALVTPTWEDEAARGVYTPPTYTAIPVVRPDAVGYASINKWPVYRPARAETNRAK